MFKKVKSPLIKGLSVGLFSFVVLAYQNCAKPLDDIGMAPSGSGNYDLPSEDPPPTIALSGSATSCSGTCTLSLTQNTANLAVTGQVFRVVKHNGSSSEDISCISTDGTSTASIALDYAAEPGLNSINAYLVANCATAIGTSSANFNVTVNPAGTVSYTWQIDPYGACSATACGTTGTQTRNVICKRNDGVTVADSYCPTPKPAISQSCSASSCSGYTYSWVTGTYGACSAVECDTSGIRTRTVTCTRNDGVAVADVYCTTTKPSSTITCFALSCDNCTYLRGGFEMCP